MLTMLFFISSCGEDFFTTTLDVEAPVPEKLLATHAYINIDSLSLDMLVSETTNILEDSYNPNHLSGTNVTLKDDLGNIDTYSLEPTMGRHFDLNTIDIAAQQIVISVEASGYEKVATAIQEIPSKVKITAATFYEDGGIDIEGEDRSAVEVIFNDPPDEENFYEAVVIVNHSSDMSNIFREATYTDSNDPIISKGSDFYSVIFDDTTFDGQEKKIKLLLYPITAEHAENRIHIQWRCITKDHFQFSKTLKQFDDQEDNPFSTPVQIYSNIENGIGLFSVYTQDIYKVF